jgi:hypothetical protein
MIPCKIRIPRNQRDKVIVTMPRDRDPGTEDIVITSSTCGFSELMHVVAGIIIMSRGAFEVNEQDTDDFTLISASDAVGEIDHTYDLEAIVEYLTAMIQRRSVRVL